MRIALIVLRLFLKVPYYIIRMAWSGKHATKENAFAYVKKTVRKANKVGRVTLDVHGLENLPKEDGFILYPNHQGMYDVMVFLDSCPRPFSFVAKYELRNVILLKQVMSALRCLTINRKDVRQGMKVIQEMSERVSNGENFLIFAEGTRSRMGNRMNEMKGGSFKAAVKAKCPIVPCALVDCFVPFDQKNTKPVTVKLFYLEPIPYEEYKDMKTVDIAKMVRERIEKVLNQYV